MLDRLQQLENNISHLRHLKDDYPLEIVKKDKKKEWALRYGLLESIQVMIDISCHIVTHQNLGNAETYADCIKLLHEFDFINDELAENLTSMAGLRNILVHEYVAVNIDQLYGLLEKLDDFNKFAAAIKENFGY